MSVHVGIEATLLKGFLQARTGWSFNSGALAPKLPSSVAIDLERHQVSAGIAASVDSLTIGVAVIHTVPTSLATDGENATLVNPVDPRASAVVGRGVYKTSAIWAMFDLQYRWR